MPLHIKRLLPALPVAAVFSLTAGTALAQTAPAAPTAPAVATDKAKVEKMVKPAGLSDRTMTKNDAAARPATRDWAQIDTNKDNSISPDEMEAYLTANPGPLAAKK